MTRLPDDDMPFVYRPIDAWPGEQTVKRRRSNYGAKWGYTLRLIKRELSHLDAHTVVCQVALEAKDFRLTDGHPKAQARASHPGVILAFESNYGPMKYAVDTFDDFTDNMRAIALSLEKLRAVDRYGVTRRGEQYRGWQQLGSGIATNEPMSKDEAWRILLDLNDEQAIDYPARNAESIKFLYKRAVKLHHPDHGGDPTLFRVATEARDALTS